MRKEYPAREPAAQGLIVELFRSLRTVFIEATQGNALRSQAQRRPDDRGQLQRGITLHRVSRSGYRDDLGARPSTDDLGGIVVCDPRRPFPVVNRRVRV